MVLGLGSDLCDIRRVERAIERFGERFLGRVFTPVERAKAERRTPAIRAATYAKRFAAKEACAKALGTGFRRGVFLQDLGVVNLASGQPTMTLTGGALAAVARDHAGRLRGACRAHHDGRVSLRLRAGAPPGRAHRVRRARGGALTGVP